jgi:hypothetical protein
METHTISALFDDYREAASAVGRLEVAGIPPQDISLISGKDAMQRPVTASKTDTLDPNAGLETGAAIGAALGGGAGLLTGLAVMTLPGVGPVVAVGWLASALAGTLAGAATGAISGGVVGAMTDAGIAEPVAGAFAEGIRRGGTLLTAKVDTMHRDKIVAILSAAGTINMDQRTAEWRNAGWDSRSH